MYNQNFRTEKYATGKFFVYTKGSFPRRIGHIEGAKTVWLAEAGHKTLGYFASKKKAGIAISVFVDSQ